MFKIKKIPILVSVFYATVFILVFGSAFLVPEISFADEHGVPLVPECGYPHEPPNDQCTFGHLMQLVNNVLTYLILIAAPIAAVIFAYAGFLMVTSAGSEERVKKAKGIFVKVLIGFIFVLAAWLIVHFIMVALVDPEFFEGTFDPFNISG